MESPTPIILSLLVIHFVLVAPRLPPAPFALNPLAIGAQMHNPQPPDPHRPSGPRTSAGNAEGREAGNPKPALVRSRLSFFVSLFGP